MKNRDAILPELAELIHDRFTGSVTLHCSDGAVVRFETNETRKPGRNGPVDLVEDRSPVRDGRRG